MGLVYMQGSKFFIQAMVEPAIQIQELTKDFPTTIRGVKVRAVDHLSLTVGDNEIFGLLGPNGSGKSTTIKIILGLLQASEGACHIYGRSSQSVSARQSVGFLPEAPYFQRYLTGRELVKFYARICGVARVDLKRQVDVTIELVGMTEAADRRVGTYSKGMLQRIGLAQALVHDPKLVILDEPTAGLDPLGSAVIAEIIRKLKESGKTILLSSHLLAQIEGLCDRVAILHRGKLVREGRVNDLLQDEVAESLIIEGLSPTGRVAVEEAITEQGGRLRRIEKPRLSLDSLFVQEVNKHEDSCRKEQTGGKS